MAHDAPAQDAPPPSSDDSGNIPPSTSPADAENRESSLESLRLSLNQAVGNALRPVSVAMGLYYALSAGWYVFTLDGQALRTTAAASGLLAVAMVTLAFWFERNTLPPSIAHPVAAGLGLLVTAHSLLLLVTRPEPQMSTHLMIAVLCLSCILLSSRWYLVLCLPALIGFYLLADGKLDDPLWQHFGLAICQATGFGFLVLQLRIRGYRRLHRLRARDQEQAERLQIAKDDALSAAKAKTEFLANMSHEIRTPMTAMLGMTELLQMTELTDAQRDFADTVARSGETLLCLVNDILDFSKIEAGQLTVEAIPLDLGSVLNDVQTMLAIKAKKSGLELVVEYPPQLPRRFRGDPNRLKQVLVNLVGNAIKFTRQGGVQIRVQVQNVNDGGCAVTIDVTDTGMGIEAGQLQRVFEAFTQADTSTTRKYGGTGLGLAISSQLTELMGGHLTVDSVPEEGSTFSVHLPLPIEVPGSLVPVQRDSGVRVHFPADVLLVEDNLENRELARRMLESFGCRVHLACDGDEALQQFAALSFDLVFMDCQMQRMNGYDATEAIRAREAEKTQEAHDGQHVPIVALTANVMPEERARCIASGMDDYVAKPFSYKDLHKVLARWVAA